MKKLLVLGAATAALAFTGSTQAAPKKAALRSITYSIPKIHCSGCSTAIAAAVKQQPGYASYNVDLKKKYFTVVYNPAKTNPTKIEQTIEKSGFPATPVKGSGKAVPAKN